MAAALERRVAGAEPDVATIRPARRLRGDMDLPGDKSISHRALMLALLAQGTSRIDGCSDGADVRSSAGIAQALSATLERLSGDGRNVSYRVTSPGPDGLRQPGATLDCGNSGTSLRLFAGILAGLPLRAVLDGDDSLRGRPVARIIEPLRSMGAELSAREHDSLPPLTVTGRSSLRPVEWTTAVPSAQVKSAILLAGLRADGTTRVNESVATRDHTERMLRARGVAVRAEVREGGGRSVSIEGGSTVQAIDEHVPGDVSAAAFWLVAATIHPDAEIVIRGTGVNPTRRAALDLLAAMGAQTAERLLRGADDDIEPVADVTARSAELRAIDIGPADVAAAIDEVPILCLAATQARGRTTIRGAGELRHKESDRIAGIRDGLSELGARLEVSGDDITIDGPTALHGADVDSRGDHRLAMTFAVAGLIAEGETRIHDAASAAVSYPGFFGDLERIRS
jgi:3-phosphoshikimate 1-carboxyvinyltransferase